MALALVKPKDLGTCRFLEVPMSTKTDGIQGSNQGDASRIVFLGPARVERKMRAIDFHGGVQTEVNAAPGL
jgi:hypothetical protein